MNPQRLGSQIQNSVILSLLCILQNPLQAKHRRDQADELQARHLCQLFKLLRQRLRARRTKKIHRPLFRLNHRVIKNILVHLIADIVMKLIRQIQPELFFRHQRHLKPPHIHILLTDDKYHIPAPDRIFLQ